VYAVKWFCPYIIIQQRRQQGGQEGQRTMKRSGVGVVAIMVGIVPALLAQSSTWYSQEEAERRLAHIQEIAAASNGRIEITVIRVPGEGGVRAHGPSAEPRGEPLTAGAQSGLMPATAEAVGLPRQPAADSLTALEASDLPWGGEFTPPENPDLTWQQQYDHALRLEKYGSLHRALRILLQLTYSHPDHTRCGECYYQMGECLTALGQRPLAQRAYRQVLRYPECAWYGDALQKVK